MRSRLKKIQLLSIAGISVIIALGFWTSNGALAADPLLPIVDKEAHMGVFSCSGSTCHGAVQKWPNSRVLQNEFVTWQRKDKHAKAYKVLLNERSKRIAKNLGLKAAHTADMCLDCHADNVVKKNRHRTFQMTDGVTCEACHGGAGRWIGTHIAANASHANNVKNGLYPAANPVSRARLCLSCHMGDASRPMTHRIMGAGHPRLSFELDTFTAIQPAHFKVDADYRKRKGNWSGVQLWAIGQTMAIDRILGNLSNPKLNSDGAFPELANFDCLTCHRSLTGQKWQARASVGLGPGYVRINDSNMLMLQIIAKRVDAKLADSFRTQALALHQSVAKSMTAMEIQAKALRTTTKRLMAKISSHNFGKADMKALLAGVIDFGMKGEFVDYSGAEQATMAASSIINAMRAGGAITGAQLKTMDSALAAVFTTVDKVDNYNSGAFLTALKKFKTTVP